MSVEKDKEPWIVCIDDTYGEFELIYWCKSEEEAIRFYEEELTGDYPDEEDRNKHLFKMIRTTGEDLS